MASYRRVKVVEARTLQDIFNHSQYPRQIAEGLLVPTILRDGLLQNPDQRQEPAGTKSQKIRYADLAGQWLVIIHQYLRPDGSIGASGKQDPKWLHLNGTTFILPPKVKK